MVSRACALVFVTTTFTAVSHASTSTTHKPCRHKDNLDIFSSWRSHDCPALASCVPHNINDADGYCSCSHSQPCLSENSDGDCVPGTASYVLASAWVLVALSAIYVTTRLGFELWRSKQLHVLRFDLLNSMCVLAIPAVGSLAIFAIMAMILHCVEVEDSTAEAFLATTAVLTALSSLFVLASLLVFGLGVRSMLVNTQRMKAQNRAKVIKRVLSLTCVVSVIAAVALLATVLSLQSGLVSVLITISALICVVLFRRVVRDIIAMEKPRQLANSLASISALERQNTAVELLQRVEWLSRHLLRHSVLFFTLAFVSTVLYFVGRELRSSVLLGVVWCALKVSISVVIVSAFFFVARFMRVLTTLRSEKADSIVHEFPTNARRASSRTLWPTVTPSNPTLTATTSNVSSPWTSNLTITSIVVDQPDNTSNTNTTTPRTSTNAQPNARLSNLETPQPQQAPPSPSSRASRIDTAIST